jgi:hypothetical protein
MADKSTFYRVVTQAVVDILDHGFDEIGRVRRWEEKLATSARASLLPEAEMDKMLRDGLAQIYERLIDKGQIYSKHPGISTFTVDKLRPELRKILDQRIMASADLIKRKRKTTIDTMMSRFSGWATSVPKGGTSQGNKAGLKDKIRRSITSLSFEERRVFIDQGHKLTASISEVVAIGGQAIAGRWRSHWKQPGYDYREDHKERDQEIYLLRDTWATEKGLVKPVGAGWYDKVTKVGEEPFCRCYMVWIYALRDLPPDMLTVKGKAELDRVRVELAS